MKRKYIIIPLCLVMGAVLLFSFLQAGAKVGAFHVPIIRFTESSEQPFVSTEERETYLITVKNISFLQSIWIKLFWQGKQIGEGADTYSGSSGCKIYQIRGREESYDVIISYADGKFCIAAADEATRQNKEGHPQ